MAEAVLGPRLTASSLAIQYQRGLAVLVVILFFSGLTVWSFDVGVSPLAPNRWLALFVALALPLLGPRHVVRVLQSPLLMWIGGYLAVTAAWFVVGDPGEAGVVQAQYRLFGVTFLMLATLVFVDERTHAPARRAMVGCVVVGVLLNVYDLTHPLAFSRDIGRAAGLYVNANISGAALTLGMVLGAGVLRGMTRHAFVILAGVGVATTQSRSAALTYVLALLVLVAGRELRVSRLVAAALVGALLGVAALWATGQLDTLLRLAGSGEILELTRLTSTTGEATEGDYYSTRSRITVARQAWQTFAEHPLLGGGLGASGYTHNMYLMHLADHGILGLAIYPAFVVATLWPIRGRERRTLVAAGLALLVWGLFSHNVLEEMHTLLAAGLAANLPRVTRDSSGSSMGASSS